MDVIPVKAGIQNNSQAILRKEKICAASYPNSLTASNCELRWSQVFALYRLISHFRWPVWMIMSEHLEEKQWIGALLDVYGGLLTDRQRDFLDLYFNEDLSYGEIAEAEDISRQAVHDTIQHGKKALLHFEEHLGLLARSQSAESVQPAAASPFDLQKLQDEVQSLSALVGEDIIYDTGPLRRRVKNLRKLAGLE